MYTKGKVDEADQPLKVVSEAVNDRWEVAVALSDKGFQQVSFVNSIATTKVTQGCHFLQCFLVFVVSISVTTFCSGRDYMFFLPNSSYLFAYVYVILT